MSLPTVLRVEGLQTYFHTYEGTVRAVEGIDLEVHEGETVGLVGETGCGKSVTALSILRLIPSPPGKIESGRVFLNEPETVHQLRREYETTAATRRPKGNRPAASAGNTGSGMALRTPGASEESIRFNTSDQLRGLLRPDIEKLDAALSNVKTDEERADLRRRLAAARGDYDLLAKSEEEMRRIRGNSISMIFQEPMTALNPVFTIGSQIAETLILHRKEPLLRSVLAGIELQEKARSVHPRGHRLEAAKEIERLLHGRPPEALEKEEAALYRELAARRPGEEICSVCRAPAPALFDWCPSCGTRLSFDLWGFVRPAITRLEKRLYTRVLRNPDDQLVDFVRSIRGLRRLVRNRLETEGVRLAVERLREVKIPEPERIAGQYPFELSGGMRQRSMIAMMMACSPKLLIADEPTTALDVTVEAQILKLMKELQERTRMSILLITHDLGIVAEVCDKVGVMYAGSIAEFGTSDQVFHRMMHPYTNGLMQSIPRFKGAASQDRKRDLYIIQGTVPNLLHPPTGCRFHPRCPRALDVCKATAPQLEEVEPGHAVACHNPVPLGEATA